MSLNLSVVAQVRGMAADSGGRAPEPFLSALQRLLGKWRSQLISNTILAKDGVAVQSGPFKGMRYTVQASEGALAPRLLGTYESELHDFVSEKIASGLERIVDIGCAEGYYAVGFALASPGSVVHAFDIDAEARGKCAQLAKDNGVEDRVEIHAEFVGDRFADYDEKTLVFIDAEGFEDVLLDPVRYPGVTRVAMVVETHPGLRPGVTERLIERFSATHDITVVKETLKTVPPGSWLESSPLSDQFHATWEWRSTPTPWLLMSPKSRRTG